MKALVILFVVGLLVGVVYGVIRLKSPAPAVVALLGLLGMVLSEQAGGWFVTKRIQLQTWRQVTLLSQRSVQLSNRESVIRPCNRGVANEPRFSI